MRKQAGRGSEPHEASAQWPLDLSELRALYGESDLRLLLTVALDEFDCQQLAFNAAFERKEWAPAAEALHRLTGTVAFFTGDERALDPLSRLERGLRRGDAVQAARAIARARAMLVAFRAALAAEPANARAKTKERDAHTVDSRAGDDLADGSNPDRCNGATERC